MSESVDNTDVTRGRALVSRQTRFVIVGIAFLCVLFLIAYMVFFSGQKPTASNSYKPTPGRAWVAPTLPPAIPVHHADTSQKKVVNKLPPATGEAPIPMIMPMGFGSVSGASTFIRPAVKTTTDAGSNETKASVQAGNPQQDGTEAQHRVGIGHATIGRPFNMHMLLRRNTIFHCVVEQPLNTAVPGPLSCTVADDVMSADGSVVLIEKGSEVEGEVLDSPASGDDLVFVGFDEVLTPQGLPIYLNGSAGDTLGMSGIPGVVNDHIWRKLKATLLLAAVQIGGNALTNATQRSRSLNFNVGSGNGQMLAQTTLMRDLNIKSTLYDPAAKVITITVRQDIPFDNVYKLVAR